MYYSNSSFARWLSSSVSIGSMMISSDAEQSCFKVSKIQFSNDSLILFCYFSSHFLQFHRCFSSEFFYFTVILVLRRLSLHFFCLFYLLLYFFGHSEIHFLFWQQSPVKLWNFQVQKSELFFHC